MANLIAPSGKITINFLHNYIGIIPIVFSSQEVIPKMQFGLQQQTIFNKMTVFTIHSKQTLECLAYYFKTGWFHNPYLPSSNITDSPYFQNGEQVAHYFNLTYDWAIDEDEPSGEYGNIPYYAHELYKDSDLDFLRN